MPTLIKAVFLDTNFFYDYVEEKCIKWNEDVDATSVKLILAPAVIREMNEHKDGGRHPRLVDAAQRTLVRLGNKFRTAGWSGACAVRDGVVMVCGEDASRIKPPLNPH